MQNYLSKILLVLMFIVSSSIFAQTQAKDPMKGVIRIQVQPEVAAQLGVTPKVRANSRSVVATGITPFDRAGQKVKAISIKRMIPYVAKFEAQRKKYGLDRWYEVTFDESVDAKEARQIYSQVAGVQIAENRVPMVLKEGNGKFKALNSAQTAALNAPQKAAALPFNDPRLSAQWHYHNDGSMAGSVAGADINLFNAWKITTGSSDVLVAIIDGGIDYTHEDLSKNVWVNTAELNGKPGVDDDGDGYIDDIYGYNFVTSSGEVYPHNHGTHVAGTVGAVNGNGIGVCGVAGGSGNGGVKMISCQIFDSRSGTGDADYAAALVYAAERGASIAQCSWGWDDDGYYEQSVLTAIDYFTEYGGGDKLKGGLCIFAAGNTGTEGNFYPGCYDKVLSVGSMCYDLTPASYSSRGSWVDITAPGGLLDFNTAEGVLSTLPGNTYGYNEGTSMATPHVSGIAALVLSKYGKPDMPNETLRQQLITSVNDFYTKNPTAVGKFGSGYIDAEKALQMGDGTAPSPVGDFTLLPSQDNITVTWNIPASSDNNVNNHIIYYSTTAFDASSDLSKVPNKTIDTKFLSSGEEMTYELAGLSAETTYYIALKSVDRWGNSAALSAVKSATTNAGPKMIIDKASLSLAATSSAPVGTGSFSISNEDQGLLKWSAFSRTKSVTPSTLSTVNPGNLRAFSGKLGVQPFEAKTVIKADEYFKGDFPKELLFWETRFAYIGDDDTSLPNAEAQYFKVDATTYPDGFNLTHLKIGGQNGEKPTIKIYKGASTIVEDNLLQNVNYSFFAYDYDIALTEQLYFAPGESFWVVVDFNASSVKYPLGMAVNEESAYKNYSYMSNDHGKTWTLLSQALKGSSYESYGDRATWEITAFSKNPDWSSVMKLTPSEGSVKAGESQTVGVSNDGQKLVNGTYNFNLHFTTNESNAADKALPVTLKVSGYTPELSSAKMVNFGDLLVGQSKTLSVQIVNNGYGNFVGSKYGSYLGTANMKSTNANFTVPTYLSGGFSARSTSTFDVTYKPTAAGSHTGDIVFTDANGVTYKFTVRGVATDPAEIAINPTDIDAGDLQVGAADATAVKFSISNTGNYPLQYAMPKFTNDTVENLGKTAHKFGYEYTSNLNGSTAFSYDGNPELVNATDITSQFSDNTYWSTAIPLGFDFPYYGTNYSEIYVTSFGGVAVNTQNLRSPLDANDYSIGGCGLISCYGHQLVMGANSKVEYAKQDGKFIVKFTNVMAVVYDNDYTPISFHLSLSANGDVEVFYDSYNPSDVFSQGRNLFLGLNDIDFADPLTVVCASTANHDYETNPTVEGDLYKAFGSGSAVKFTAPNPNMIASIAPASGVVNPGESLEVTANVAATSAMNAGKITNKLVILSNDPNHTTSYVNLSANVVGDLKPAITLAAETVDFGNVFRTATVKQPVTVKNSGKDVLEITSIALTGNKFNFDLETPVSIPAGLSKDILVTIPTVTEGAVEDVMTITTNAGTATATLKGKVIGCPTAILTPTSVTETLESGARKDMTLQVKNDGNEPLVYSITPNSFIGLDSSTGENGKVDYIYKATVDDSSIAYNWVDIETNGKGTQNNLTYYLTSDFVEVALPFEFPYYGKKYNKMYIYNTGFVSFTKRNDDKIWPEPPADFPTGSLYNNLIAPYWGMHSMDQTKTAGTYHYETEDQAVVSFMEYGNSMNIGVDYQVILNKDGSFKFQYKGNNESAIIYGMFGLAGICNADATSSIQLPERCVAFEKAIEFYPVKTAEVAAGSTETVNYQLIANCLAGHYDSNIEINTNVPGSETVKVPIDLTVTGTAKPAYPTAISAEYVKETPFDIDFMIENNGTAPFTITSMTAEMPFSDLFYDDAMALSWYGEYDAGFGFAETGYWNNAYYPMPSTVVGNTPVKLRLTGIDVYAVKALETTITLNVTGLEGIDKITIPVKIDITPAPVMAFDKEEIRVTNAASNYKGISELTVKNEGEYKLTYSLRLDPTGVGEEDTTSGGGVAPTSTSARSRYSIVTPETDSILKAALKPVIKPFADTASGLDLPAPSLIASYSNALYYPVFPGTTAVYFYGAVNTFDEYTAATYFTAPSEGFNLTHVYTAYNVQNLENVDLKVSIVKGDDPAGTTVLGRGTYHIEKMTQLPMGEMALIELDKPVYLEPGQDFYVEITFPAGVERPAYVAAKEEAVVSNRYMGYFDTHGSWYDVASVLNSTYGSMGYITSCIEKEPGSSWVKMLTDETSGEIAVNGSKTIQIQLNAASAPLDKDNKAVLVIKSNDPTKTVYNYPISLDKNVAPTVTVPSATTYVNENTTTTVDVTVVDSDADAMTIQLNDVDGIATLTSCTAIDATENPAITIGEDKLITVGKSASGVKIVATLAPSFGQEGAHSFTVTATDDNGYEATGKANYYVDHTNRAPVAVEFNDITIVEGTASASVDFDKLFTDPDGDAMTYTMSNSNGKVATPYTSGNSVIFIGASVGESTVVVTATDANGATAQCTFKVVVTSNSSIDEVTMKNAISVYPNPVVNDVHIACGIDADEIGYKLYDINGGILYDKTADHSGNDAHIINMSSYAAGVYMLELTANGTKVTVPVIKK